MKKVYWKNIPGYENYQGSNYGEIKSLKFGKEKILKQTLTKGGYYQIGLRKKGEKQKMFYVHQLICMVFLGHVIDGHITVIDHKDLNKGNNYIGTPEGNYEDGNLHIVTNRDNGSICSRKDRETMSSKLPGASWRKSHNKCQSQYYYQGKVYHLGLFNTDMEASDKWKEAYEADKNGTFELFILTIETKKIKSINQYTKSGEFIREWNNASEASKELGIANENITSCCRGRIKSAGGFIWKYK